MPLTSLDYRVVATGLVNSVVCKNVFWYKATDPGAEAGQLALLFESTIIPAIATVQSSDFQWTNLDIYNLVEPSDFYTGTLSDVGDRGALAMPNFVAWYVRYFRSTTLTANGRKMIAGVSESDVSDGVIVPAVLVTMDLMTDVLETALVGGFGTDYIPCIAKTEEYTNPETGKTYRVPIELFGISRVEYVRVSTQNSRKR